MSQKIPLSYALPAILISTLVVIAIVFAWTEPTAPPPGDQVPAPLNVGGIAQEKTGSLYIATEPGSRVGIGTATPEHKLHVVGGNIYAPDNVRDDCVWTAWTCASGTTEEGQICPENNQFLAGVARGTASSYSLCGSGSRQYYQMSLYCCQI